MIHHIVMFKLSETPGSDQKDKNRHEVKTRLEALPAQGKPFPLNPALLPYWKES